MERFINPAYWYLFMTATKEEMKEMFEIIRRAKGKDLEKLSKLVNAELKKRNFNSRQQINKNEEEIC